MTDRPIAAKPFTGRHMLMIMVLFFGVIISVNVMMAVMANRTWTGLVVKNSYVASQNFNAELREARRQEARGWQTSLAYANGLLTLKLRDRANAPVLLDDVRAVIGRPAFENQDRMVELRQMGDGTYGAEMALAPGNWSVRITGGSGERSYRRDARFLVKGDDDAAGRR